MKTSEANVNNTESSQETERRVPTCENTSQSIGDHGSSDDGMRILHASETILDAERNDMQEWDGFDHHGAAEKRQHGRNPHQPKS